MPGLGELIGTSYGPFPVDLSRERAAAFSLAVGDDPSVWTDRVHPMLANAALFSVAPTFLSAGGVVPYTRSLIHSEQTYEWHRTPAVGAAIEVTGTVDGVRARGSLNLVNFSFVAGSPDVPWVTGSSVFVMSDEAAASAADASEPGTDDRPPVTDRLEPRALPDAGEDLEPVLCGASRSDLARYAGASGDSNPIHLDHGAARAAGLEGVIVHGLLMAAWVGRVAARYGALHTMRVRFRNPLRPAVAATIDGKVAAATAATGDLDLDLSAGDLRVLTARVSVTR